MVDSKTLGMLPPLSTEFKVSMGNELDSVPDVCLGTFIVMRTTLYNTSSRVSRSTPEDLFATTVPFIFIRTAEAPRRTSASFIKRMRGPVLSCRAGPDNTCIPEKEKRQILLDLVSHILPFTCIRRGIYAILVEYLQGL